MYPELDVRANASPGYYGKDINLLAYEGKI